MFKENKEFWGYVIGIIVGIIAIYFLVIGYQFPITGFLTSEDSKKFEYKSAPIIQIDPNKDYRANIVTNKGTIEIDLYEKNAPFTVNNFVFLAQEGYYNNVKFHRIIRDFIIQTGSRNTLNNDPNDDGFGDPGYQFQDEINLDSLNLSAEQRRTLEEAGYSNDTQVVSRRLEKYSVAMANAGPDTNGSQFFIVLAENDDPRLSVLQGRHTVFGSVIGGFDVLDILNQARLEKIDDDVPSHPLDDLYIIRIDVSVL